jgi:hypothetical protein
LLLLTDIQLNIVFLSFANFLLTFGRFNLKPMKTKDHEFRSLDEIDNIQQLEFRNIVGSIRLILERIVLKKDSDKMVEEFMHLKLSR